MKILFPNPKLGKKGQAAAPFELFVAVIIMGFVMIIGSVVLMDVNSKVCLDSVDKEMSKFKLSLEDTVNKRSAISFDFHPQEACFSSKETVMKIELETSSAVCASRCGTPLDECYVMTFSNSRVAGAFKQKCIDLPPYTSFLTETSCYEADASSGDTTSSLTASGYVTVNPTLENTGIKIGKYALRNISSGGDPYSKVCVWFKA